MIMTPQSAISGDQPTRDHHVYSLLMRGVWEGNKANSEELEAPLGDACRPLRKPSIKAGEQGGEADIAAPAPHPSDRVGAVAMGYVGKHGVEALHKYKYSGVDRSYMAKYVLQPFWTRFVKLFPLWMPPNMITLIGFLFVAASAILSYIYSPHLTEPSPRWVFVLHGLLLFLYQTFDAVDGKQARRTNSSSPLGELFDHGCDALTCALEAMAFGSALLSGRKSLWFYMIATIPFFGATWESFFTNTLILPEINGPTEGLMLIYLAHFFTALVGPQWWTQSLREVTGVSSLPDVPLNIVVIAGMMLFAVTPTVLYSVSNVQKEISSKKGNIIPALAMLLPFISLVGGVSLWGWLSPSDVLGNYPHVLLLGTGFAFGFLVGRIILAHLCDEHKGLKTGMYTSLLVLPFCIANAVSAKLNDGKPFVNEWWMLLVFSGYTIALYLHFATSVIHEITSALGIYCFRIMKKEGKKA